MSVGGDGHRGGGKIVRLHDRPLSPPREMARIKELWRQGNFTWTPHAEERLSARKLNITDVENIIRFGHVVESSKPGKEWRYTVAGPSIEQQPAAIIANCMETSGPRDRDATRTWR